MQTTAAYLQTTIMTVSKKVAHKSGAQSCCSNLLQQTCWQELVSRPCSTATPKLAHQKFAAYVLQHRYTAGCSSRAMRSATPENLGCFCALSSAILHPMFPFWNSNHRFWSAAFKWYQLFQSSASQSAIQRPWSALIC